MSEKRGMGEQRHSIEDHLAAAKDGLSGPTHYGWLGRIWLTTVPFASRNDRLGIPSAVTCNRILFRPFRSMRATLATPSLSWPMKTRRRVLVGSLSDRMSPTMWFFESSTPAS